MDFELSSEQSLLKDSVDRFVSDAYDLEQRRALTDSSLGYSEDNWRLFAEMGWLGLLFSEENGGYGGTPVEASILMESFGEGLVVEPFVASILLGGRLIELAGSTEQRQALLPPLIEGKLRLALAHSEPQSRYDLNDVATTAVRSENGWRLDGAKSFVGHAASADKILIVARTSGERRDHDGLSVFLVDNEISGLARQDYKTLDGSRASDLRLDGVRVGEDALVGEVDGALPAVEQVIDLAICAIGAEAVGAMRKVNEITTEYAKTRKQFGTPIGANQVIKHRLADMLIEYEQSKAMSDMAAMKAAMAPGDIASVASAAKARIGEAARFVGEQGIQLHGGIGMTDEYVIGHYYKRLMVLESLFGNPDHHLRRFAEAG